MMREIKAEMVVLKLTGDFKSGAITISYGAADSPSQSAVVFRGFTKVKKRYDFRERTSFSIF